jgi:hypothetical protein
MAFSDFHYPDVLATFGLTYDPVPDLFRGVADSPPRPGFGEAFVAGSQLASILNNEKARSEWLIAPVLGEFWWRYRGRIGLYSGFEFAADPAAGLTGYWDFILSRSPQHTIVTAPAVMIVEAKRENIIDGLGQCVAGVVGAQRFNRRGGTPIDPVYGCVTTGSVWKFLRLAGTTLSLDLAEYTITQVPRLLGIFTSIFGPAPEQAAA